MGHPYFLASAAGMVEVTSKFSSWWKTPVLHQFYICFTYEKNSQLEIFHTYFSARQRIKANIILLVLFLDGMKVLKGFNKYNYLPY